MTDPFFLGAPRLLHEEPPRELAEPAVTADPLFGGDTQPLPSGDLDVGVDPLFGAEAEESTATKIKRVHGVKRMAHRFSSFAHHATARTRSIRDKSSSMVMTRARTLGLSTNRLVRRRQS
jgi:hypothetical protein